MTKIDTDDFGSIYEALQTSQRMYSAKFIRELRGSVFRLAEHIDPTSDVIVSGIEVLSVTLNPIKRL